jgi:hypothetical protein
VNITFATQTGDQAITGDVAITGDLSVSDDLSAPAVYAESSTTYATRPLAIGADGKIYGTGDTLAVNAASIGATTPGTGAFTTLTSTGAADFATTLSSGTGNAFSVAATGVITDVAIYTATPGAGIAKWLCMASDGVIYGSATTCK